MFADMGARGRLGAGAWRLEARGSRLEARTTKVVIADRRPPRATSYQLPATSDQRMATSDHPPPRLAIGDDPFIVSAKLVRDSAHAPCHSAHRRSRARRVPSIRPVRL